jgi:hypothetical protein
VAGRKDVGVTTAAETRLELADKMQFQIENYPDARLNIEEAYMVIAALRATEPAGAGLWEALSLCLEVLQTVRRVYIENPKAPTSPLIDITIAKAEAALASPPSAGMEGRRGEIARIIWNGFARQGGEFEHAKGTVDYAHCIGLADAIPALSRPARSPGENTKDELT